MTNLPIIKEKERPISAPGNAVLLREISYLEPSLDENRTAPTSNGKAKTILTVSLIVLLYAISIASLIVAALHETALQGP